MRFTRKDWEDAEERQLNPYASKSAHTLGRLHSETPHATRSCFARDRDRIFHSRCFRRLEYKTQVFVNGIADHYRTRLTHTMEMTAVGRTLARTLSANEDLTECICLAHDLGHSPFGHEGEHILNTLMEAHGGFDHNLQSLRCIETLESPYPTFTGLNLSWEVRAGLLKHEAHKPNATLDGHPIGPFQSLEAQIADIADDMTYQAHDVDDGLEAGIMTLEKLQSTRFWNHAAKKIHQLYPNANEEQKNRATIRTMIELQVADVIEQARIRLDQYQPTSVRAVMEAPERIICFSDEMKVMLDEFTKFMFTNLYYHSTVKETTSQRVEWMRRLFLYYIENPHHLGSKAQQQIKTEGLHRSVCDYVAGCTDRFALLECEKYGLLYD
ncbi:MAG: deoxyguanosinetriphosphate triphosphohydrolase [Kiritimatiellaceae bacterium]|jgi:dGTPase|nr:deoxyguanosinetriphosphate triphosphohydrolase [Kiritimatiellaceae bacterium]|tara:strand:+ start:629 stop:1777 length:1149 start_codon:yes stop_codon:yes gene_type:complete